MKLSVNRAEKNGIQMKVLDVGGYGGRSINGNLRIESYYAASVMDHLILVQELVQAAGDMLPDNEERVQSMRSLLDCICSDIQDILDEEQINE